MSDHPTESKRLLSHTIAEWACALKYEHLSPAAIQAAKLFWFDSIGCALGGSQQNDARILLKHYRAMGGGKSADWTDSSGGEGVAGTRRRPNTPEIPGIFPLSTVASRLARPIRIPPIRGFKSV